VREDAGGELHAPPPPHPLLEEELTGSVYVDYCSGIASTAAGRGGPYLHLACQATGPQRVQDSEEEQVLGVLAVLVAWDDGLPVAIRFLASFLFFFFCF